MGKHFNRVGLRYGKLTVTGKHPRTATESFTTDKRRDPPCESMTGLFALVYV